MTKRKFLKELEERLKILNDNERKDIIDDYTNMIDEKIREGKKELEAVKDFEDMDELVSNILDAYKINPNYTKGSASDTKKVMDNIENGISSLAKELGDGAKRLYNNFKKKNGDINVDLLFEIIIKVILLLFGLMFLRIPFEIISDLGKGLFDIFLYPFDLVLGVIWQIVVGIIFFAFAILIIISVFKKYFYIDETTKQESNEKKENTEKLKKNETPKQELKGEKAFKSIIKIFFTFMVLLPIWCINFSLIIAIAVVIYLIFKGIEIVGILVLLIGLSFLFGYLADAFRSVIYNHKKIYFFPFAISAILITVGSLMFAETAFSFNYKNNLVESNLYKEVEYREIVNENTLINTKEYLKDFIIDETLEDNVVVIKVDYYGIRDIKKINLNNIIEISFKEINDKKRIFDLFVDDLKNKEIYNYENLDEAHITIYTNSKTRNLVS